MVLKHLTRCPELPMVAKATTVPARFPPMPPPAKAGFEWSDSTFFFFPSRSAAEPKKVWDLSRAAKGKGLRVQ